MFQFPRFAFRTLLLLLILPLCVWANTVLSSALGIEIKVMPDAYSIEVTQLQLCDGIHLNSYFRQQLPQSAFAEEQVFICGHLRSLTPSRPSYPHFYIMPEEGGAIWHKEETIRFEEGEFFIPIRNVTPETGTYTINLHKGKDILYSAEFEVIP